MHLRLLLHLLLATLAASQQITHSGFGGRGNGVTELRPDGIIRLTNETSRLLGHAFYPSPLRLLGSPGCGSNRNGTAVSFSMAFAFAVVPEYPRLGGHGFAFVAAPDPRIPGALPNQYLGLLSAADLGNATSHVFAVEFDTVQDFDLVSNASASAAPVNLKSGDTVLAWVDYDGDRRLLNVSIATTSEKPTAPLISFHVDLSTIFLDQMYVGFSASTGLLASSHYLMGWSFKLGGGAAPPLDLSSLPSLPQPKPDKRSKGRYRYKNREVIELWELDYGPHRYKYPELKHTTRGFRERELLGCCGELLEQGLKSLSPHGRRLAPRTEQRGGCRRRRAWLLPARSSKQRWRSSPPPRHDRRCCLARSSA
ncbi:hypothetical protein QYE76_011739 [Lolium multiflorum]|uniref:Legume lectin domain-containing protein n=1 Tax=Lolium multiflorum TaxID=4521 RepID=A0AAD8X5L2_LOLMU|nr:hypothetical protein QYE76_011739 [Lolium multiflorum]